MDHNMYSILRLFTLFNKGMLLAISIILVALAGCYDSTDQHSITLFNNVKQHFPDSASLDASIGIDGTSVALKGGFDTAHLTISFPVKIDNFTSEAVIDESLGGVTVSLGNRSRKITAALANGAGGLGTYSPRAVIAGNAFNPLGYGSYSHVVYVDDNNVDDIQTSQLHANYTPAIAIKGSDSSPELDLWVDRGSYYPVQLQADDLSLRFGNYNQKITAPSHLASHDLQASPLQPAITAAHILHCDSSHFQWGSFPKNDLRYTFTHDCINDVSNIKDASDLVVALAEALGKINEATSISVDIISAVVQVYIYWMQAIDQNCISQGNVGGADLHFRLAPFPLLWVSKPGTC